MATDVRELMRSLAKLICGPAGSGKTTLALAHYVSSVANHRPGKSVWLSPSGRAAAGICDRLVRSVASPAILAPGVMTFASLAAAVVHASRQPVRRIGALEKRVLVGRIIDDTRRSGQFRHFRAVAGSRGLVDLVVQFIAEWKRLEIWPEDFRAAAERRGRTAKDAELAMLYETYQATLTKRQWFDAEGQIWLARALLRDGQARPLAELEWLVADGFSDFTRTEHEILELLADRAEHFLVTLPDDAGEERSDLFAKARRTAQQIQLRHPGCQVERLPARSDGGWPAMEHLERRLFGHPRHAVDASNTGRMEVLAAGRELGELELIAARIKSLLLNGDPTNQREVRPGEIAVVYRQLEAAAPLIREVLERFGIPYYLERAKKLSEAPLVVALSQLLRLHAEDWPQRALVGVLNQYYFRPRWPGWNALIAAHVELAVRAAQLPRGRSALLARCERAAESIGGTPSLDEAADQSPDIAASTRDFVGLLSAALSRFPERAAPQSWLARLEQIARELGYFESLSDADTHAWRQLTEASAALGRLADELSDVRALDAREFLAWLDDVVTATPAAQPSDEIGRVRVLAAASVRALEIPYLFVAGLSEKAFPTADSEGRAYGETECRALVEAGLPLVLRAERAEEEMLLFYETITRARRRLYLSYPAIDERAQPLSPSPYVTEVERAFGAAPLERQTTADLSPIPAPGAIWNERDWRVSAVVAAAKGEPHSLSELASQTAGAVTTTNIHGGLRTVQARSSGDGFGPFEGMLPGGAAQRNCARRFDTERIWSATELEDYGECPFRFFMARVLRLAPLPDPELKTDYLGRGARMHAVLAALHRHVNLMHEPGTHPQSLDVDSYQELIKQLLSQLESPEARVEESLAGALDALQRRELHEWLTTYREQHEQYAEVKGHAGQVRPLYFEAAFGLAADRRAGEPARDVISVDECLELQRGADAVRIAGRIDRIDVADVQGRLVFNVLDYKTGKHPSSKAIESGRALQLPLYALAVERLLLRAQQALPWQIGYWSVADKGYRGGLQLASQDDGAPASTGAWRELVEAIEEQIFGLVRGLRHAEFPMYNTDKKCTSTCDFRTVCRVNQVRSLEKTWQPPQETPSA